MYETAAVDRRALQEVRQLLRMLRRPFLLEQNRLARALRQAYDAADPLAAVMCALRESFYGSPAFGEIYREIVERCDVRAESTKRAAFAMHMSVRTFFRFRKEAITLVATTVSRKLHALEAPRMDARAS